MPSFAVLRIDLKRWASFIIALVGQKDRGDALIVQSRLKVQMSAYGSRVSPPRLRLCRNCIVDNDFVNKSAC